MATPPGTVQISTQIFFQDNIPAKGLRVKAELQSASQNPDGYIIPEISEFIVDDNGDVTLDLWPNNNGNTGTFYKIIAHDDKLQHYLEVFAIIPESVTPLRLEDIALPITTLDLANSSGSVPSCRLIETCEGLVGGGDLSTNRKLKLDLETITPELLDPELTDIIAIQRPGSNEVHYVRLQNVPGFGFCTSEEHIATLGQTVFNVVAPFTSSEQIEVFIEGGKQFPSSFVVDEILKTVTLSEPLEGTEEVEIKICQNAEAVLSLDASQVTYNTTNVEIALNNLYSATGISPWQLIVNDYLASPADRLFVDVAAGPINITLPANPGFGDSVEFIDVSTPGASISTNNLNILRNGENIMGIPDDLLVDEDNISFRLIYAGASYGWRLSE